MMNLNAQIRQDSLKTCKCHYSDVIMGTMAYQITNLTIVYSAVLLRRGSKKTSKLRVTVLCVGNSPVIGEFPAQRVSNTENTSIWWRHLDELTNDLTQPVACHLFQNKPLSEWMLTFWSLWSQDETFLGSGRSKHNFFLQENTFRISSWSSFTHWWNRWVTYFCNNTTAIPLKHFILKALMIHHQSVGRVGVGVKETWAIWHVIYQFLQRMCTVSMSWTSSLCLIVIKCVILVNGRKPKLRNVLLS